jgi:hypothetical protein
MRKKGENGIKKGGRTGEKIHFQRKRRGRTEVLDCTIKPGNCLQQLT